MLRINWFLLIAVLFTSQCVLSGTLLDPSTGFILPMNALIQGKLVEQRLTEATYDSSWATEPLESTKTTLSTFIVQKSAASTKKRCILPVCTHKVRCCPLSTPGESGGLNAETDQNPAATLYPSVSFQQYLCGKGQQGDDNPDGKKQADMCRHCKIRPANSDDVLCDRCLGLDQGNKEQLFQAAYSYAELDSLMNNASQNPPVCELCFEESSDDHPVVTHLCGSTFPYNEECARKFRYVCSGCQFKFYNETASKQPTGNSGKTIKELLESERKLFDQLAYEVACSLSKRLNTDIDLSLIHHFLHENEQLMVHEIQAHADQVIPEYLSDSALVAAIVNEYSGPSRSGKETPGSSSRAQLQDDDIRLHLPRKKNTCTIQ